MSPFEKLFGRKGGAPSAEQPRLRLTALCAALSQRRPAMESAEVDPVLVRAWLADFYRDQGLEPLHPDTFLTLCVDLMPEGWRRLALVTDALTDGAVGPVVAALARIQGVEKQVRAGFVDFARETHLLTLELVGLSELRLEELARRWVHALGAGIEGESPEESAQRLKRLDYTRLLEEAERAKRGAESRQEKLKKLREEQDKRMAPRGKW
ncbi:hypothetical protein [Myxococcus sp. RHSTA-1-4]|uniref:hypothetical protein n=1 Tax=Myxococcus sp. RHSTA-1-4 TaxID=2874601 RepID=UPI001CBB3295|nr:hypothetical protein [Myxococcus sp. RHSTA-1-4]MBZ4421326.1 hypothetical protein [Myxococcus sp. RHSTA-1-4]